MTCAIETINRKKPSVVTSDGGSWSFFQDASEPFSLKGKKKQKTTEHKLDNPDKGRLTPSIRY